MGFSAQPRAEQNVTTHSARAVIQSAEGFSAQPRAEQNVTWWAFVAIASFGCFSAQPRAEQNVTQHAPGGV